MESRECPHLERARHIKEEKRKDLKRQNGVIKKGELEWKLRRAIIANALNDHGRKKKWKTGYLICAHFGLFETLFPPLRHCKKEHIFAIFSSSPPGRHHQFSTGWWRERRFDFVPRGESRDLKAITTVNPHSKFQELIVKKKSLYFLWRFWTYFPHFCILNASFTLSDNDCLLDTQISFTVSLAGNVFFLLELYKSWPLTQRVSRGIPENL